MICSKKSISGKVCSNLLAAVQTSTYVVVVMVVVVVVVVEVVVGVGVVVGVPNLEH